ncbi:hypothetical protein DPEC_G00333200 [Dallia pectoralis]|uniref:Uncharacterized protein n=1 Tax=Dallia pectoralis TaxID=75939 RepID=A0ACC2F687_DALPE|nr:hypothetical protein DPEC_G00333200 [Dallia pectoralis]
MFSRHCKQEIAGEDFKQTLVPRGGLEQQCGPPGEALLSGLTEEKGVLDDGRSWSMHGLSFRRTPRLFSHNLRVTPPVLHYFPSLHPTIPPGLASVLQPWPRAIQTPTPHPAVGPRKGWSRGGVTVWGGWRLIRHDSTGSADDFI